MYNYMRIIEIKNVSLALIKNHVSGKSRFFKQYNNI